MELHWKNNMINVISHLMIFIIIIILGIILKRIGLFTKKDSQVVSRIVVYLTLPCALLSNANNIHITSLTFKMIMIAIVTNLILAFIGYFLAPMKKRAPYMLCGSGYNIGNFALPFVQLFFPGTGVAYLCMFDIGNSIMGLGATYVIANSLTSKGKMSLKKIVKRMISSIPFDTYMIMLLLALCSIHLPDYFLTVTKTIGSGNAFLSMLMIGLMIEPHIPQGDVKDIIKIILIRILGNVALVLFIIHFISLPALATKILAIALFTPVTSVAPVFSEMCHYDGDIPAVTSSISIVVSIIEIVIVMMILG